MSNSDYILKNMSEGIAGFLFGIPVGFVSEHRAKENGLAAKSESSKLGLAALFAVFSNPLDALVKTFPGFDSNYDLVREASGDFGNLVGLYAGFKVGQFTERLGRRFYSNTPSRHNHEVV